MCRRRTSFFNETMKEFYAPGPDETIEDLQLGGLRLIQKKNGFRFGMDAVLLADFARINPGDTVADFGTGSGILPVLLAGRGKGRFYYAVDCQEDMCALAERNLAMNGLKGCVICMDLARTDEGGLPRNLDAIVSNPPYAEPNAALASPSAAKATARNQSGDTMDGFLGAAFRALKGRGRLSMIYPAPSMLRLMSRMQEHHLEPKRFRLVYPSESKNANLVLVEAVKDAKPGLHPMPPLIIRGQDGDLTNELKSIYHMNAESEDGPNSAGEGQGFEPDQSE
ncbi:MAG: methyltransferase [Clostridia bacterium]|nr:methyltransferase [Clostridia bacterium]